MLEYSEACKIALVPARSMTSMNRKTKNYKSCVYVCMFVCMFIQYCNTVMEQRMNGLLPEPLQIFPRG